MIRIFIADKEITCSNKIKISEELLTTSSTILNSCYPISWEEDKDYVSRFYFPRDYSRCEIYDDEDLVFCGVVKNTGNISLNPRYPKFVDLQILDYKTFLSEGEDLNFVISGKTVTEAIEMVTNAVSEYGFVLGNINIKDSDYAIGAYSTLDKSPYDVYQYFAEITGSLWFTRRVDKNAIAIDFYDPDYLLRANDIEYTTEYFEENNILDDIKISYSTSDYRNKQIIKSKQVYSNIDSVEEQIANGYTTEFLTEKAIGILKSVKVDGVEKSFATNEEKDFGISSDFYYSAGELKITSNITYSQGSKIDIQYTAIVQGREIAYNNSEITRISNQLGIKGIISRYEDRNDVLYSKQLNSIAQSYIKFKGKPDFTLTISTTNKNLFAIGQQTYFDAPIDILKGDYMVKNKTIEEYVNGRQKYTFYTYQLSSNYNAESSINYFDNQRRKSIGNISQDEYISRNIDIENTANIIFSNLRVNEIEITGNNTLDAILDAPFMS